MGVSFDALPVGLMAARRHRALLREGAAPGFEVYASPVNISPASPPQEITSPEDFVEELAAKLGHFYTQGMPEETNALKDGIFDDDDYVKQVALVQQDARAMLDLALDRFEPGGRHLHLPLGHRPPVPHALAPRRPEVPGAPAIRRGIPRSPPRTPTTSRATTGTSTRLLGRVRERLPEDTAADRDERPRLPALHAQVPPERLAARPGLPRAEGRQAHRPRSALGDVDWSKTRAYGIGFNGLYLNLAGPRGAGHRGARARPTRCWARSRAALEAERDPKTGEAVVLRVFRGRGGVPRRARRRGPRPGRRLRRRLRRAPTSRRSARSPRRSSRTTRRAGPGTT